MALARLTCGACGAPLSLQDAVCPKCKTPVELPGGGERVPGAGHAGGAEPGGGVACAVCGHMNSPTAEYCRSCGARFSPAPVRRVMKGGARPRGSARRSEEGQGKNGSRRDPWPYMALLAIVTLIAVVVYTQWDRTPSRPGLTQVNQGSAPPHAVEPAALLRLEQAVEADPNDQGSLLHLANALQDDRQFSRAVDNYTRYLALRPKDADARVDMGICLYQMGLADSARALSLFASAIREMRTGIAGTPGHQPAAFNIGIVYLQLGNLDSSNAWFKRAVAINKTSELGTRAQRILEQHLNAQ